MKKVTIIVKDIESGTSQKFNATLDREHKCLKGVIGGVSVSADIKGYLELERETQNYSNQSGKIKNAALGC
ncbi:TPA: hypothetical protein LUK65_003731 [Escherichia coli]|nr:hypothetical protein [Escherichia coli]HBM2295290.1 hypothetical protein [Escherichia coli]HEF0535414.1 hypothetical protein [Escherichia coli]